MKIKLQNNMSQEEAMKTLMPIIEESGKEYAKFTKVFARPAEVGEKIETFTSDGKETTVIAKEDDYVVRNMTEAKEEYIINKSKLDTRYKQITAFLRTLDGKPWKLYQAVGEIKGIKINTDETLYFVASWGEKMPIKDGDMIATPLPKKDEVYRIAQKEFKETYKLKD